MEPKHKIGLMAKVLMIGVLIAVLSYLFHPETGQLMVTLNGQPVPETLVKLAAVPTFLLVLCLVIALSVLLFFGVGFFMFVGTLFFALAICMVMAPYFWPIPLIIFLVVSLSSYDHKNKTD